MSSSSSDNFLTTAIGQIPVHEYVGVAKDFINNVTAYTVSYDVTHNYQISLLAKYIHRVPRFDVDLKSVNNSFDPYSSHYLESLGIWVAIPGFWLVLTLLLFLIFFICRCCAISTRQFKGDDDSIDGSLAQEGKKRSSATSNCCSRFFLFTLAIMTICFIGIGLYGCLQMQIGMYQVQSALHNISYTVDSCRNQTSTIQSSMNSIMKDSLSQLAEAANRQTAAGRPAANSFVLSDYFRSSNDSQRLINYKIDDIEHELYTVRLDNTEKILSTIEDYRRPISIIVIAILMFINMILIYGVSCNSRCFLLMYGIFGLVAIIICWLCCSLYLGLAIVTSDYCHNPQPFFLSSKSREPQEIFDHYLYCPTVPEVPLFQKKAQRPISAIRDLEDLFTSFAEKTNSLREHLKRERNDAVKLITPVSQIISNSLVSLDYVRSKLACDPLHTYYTNGMSGLCKTAFEGAFLTLLVMTFGGLLFTLLVLSSSQLWISIRKHRQAPAKADVFTDYEVDPFLPGSSASTSSSSRRNNLSMSHYGMLPTSARPSAPAIQTRNRVNEENLAFLSPPPAYDHLQQQQLSHHHQMTYGNAGHSYTGQPYSRGYY